MTVVAPQCDYDVSNDKEKFMSTAAVEDSQSAKGNKGGDPFMPLHRSL